MSRRTSGHWFLFLLCAAIFLALRLHEITKKDCVISQSLEKPTVPPFEIKTTHPWLKNQQSVKGAAIEIMRDLEKMRHICHSLPHINEDDVLALMINKLLSLQVSIPFHFPDTLYNVLCITHPESDSPFSFYVYKRLYLGESDLGLPFYLDVRVFDLNNPSDSELIIAWHKSLLEGMCEEISNSENRLAILCRGPWSSNRKDTTHGFATIQGERALFLDFCEKKGQLFVCYAEASSSIFNQYEPFFRYLASQPI